MHPAIVVVAYNRPECLHRLLSCLLKAHYHQVSVQLVISVDFSEDNAVINLANQFHWPFGEKEVILHKEHLGLKNHVIACGDLSIKYGSIILLEDDLVVSTWFYDFASQALSYYESETQIAGISLYNYAINENNFEGFKAIDDNSDVYFMQVAASWGQVWHSKQWQAFKTWLIKNPEAPKSIVLPQYLTLWSKHSWKRDFIHYLIYSNSYFVYPRLSFTTNSGVQGTNQSGSAIFNVPIQLHETTFVFTSFQQSTVRYDAWFEPEAKCLQLLNTDLQNYDFAVDLLGTKNSEAINKPFVLTRRPVNHPILQFSKALFPLQDNVIANLQGSGLFLVRNEPNAFKLNAVDASRNFFNPINNQNKFWLSVQLLVNKFNEREIVASLRSVEIQNYAQLSIHVFCTRADAEATGKVLSNYPLQCEIHVVNELPITELNAVNARHSDSEQISITLFSGMILQADIFHKATQIFSEHKYINWLTGIEPCDDKVLDTRRFRINAAEAYHKLCNNSLKASISAQFIRQSCFTAFKEAHLLSQEDFYLQLITRFEPVTVVLPFVDSMPNVTASINQSEWKQLLQKHRALRKPKSVLDLLLNKLSLINGNRPAFKHWLYTSKNHYHDVLRYDEKHGSFYYSKY